MAHDYLILNALCLDGSGAEPFKANLAVSSDLISYIGNGLPNAHKVIDADGLVLTPGFIDTHAHSEFTLAADGRAQGRIAQGVTTEINGNCGLSAGPIIGEALIQRRADFLEYGLSEIWQDFEGFYRLLKKRGIAINIATFCGQGNLRASVMGYVKGRADESAMARMIGLLKESVKSGAKGLSTGLIYPPGVFTETDELIEICRALAEIKPDALYVPHMRSETDQLIEAIQESIEIASKSGLRLHISHLKTGGKGNWHKIDKVIETIEEALESGLNITCDRYPYVASSTDLDTILPKEVFEGGVEQELRRLNDPNTLAEIKRRLQVEPEELWSEILISSTYTDKNRWMEGKSLSEIASKLNKSPIDVALELIIADRSRTGAIFFSMSEDNLRRFLKLPYMMIGSDSAVRSFDGPTCKGKPHPRGFGSFPRFIGRYVRDEGLMDLPEAIRRITSLPAKTFGLERRGLLKEGYFADLTLFDYKAITDHADFVNPFQRPEGVRWVFINGVPAYADGEFTGSLSGRILN